MPCFWGEEGQRGEIFLAVFGVEVLAWISACPLSASSSISHPVMCSGLPSLPPAVVTMRREVETSETATVSLNRPHTKIMEVF